MTVDRTAPLDAAAPPAPVTTKSFADAMASVCTPVAVITAMDGDRPHGTTVSAFASLSATPPSMLVSLDSNSQLLELIRARGRFGVNVLSAGQADTALRFAKKGTDKFEGSAWTLEEGSPRVADAATWVACSALEFINAADHVIVVGEVLTSEVMPLAPLAYHGRAFGTWSPAPALPPTSSPARLRLVPAYVDASNWQ